MDAAVGVRTIVAAGSTHAEIASTGVGESETVAWGAGAAMNEYRGRMYSRTTVAIASGKE